MSFAEAVRKCLSDYTKFDGRAARSEFWWWFLFTVLVSWILAIPGLILVVAGASTLSSSVESPNALFWLGLFLLVVGSVVQLALVIPTYAVGCRRLHDRGQSGWLQLLVLVPCGNIVLLIFWVMEGTPGDNAYGPKPA